MTGHRALEKKQITQGNNRKVQNPGGSPHWKSQVNHLLLATFFVPFFCFIHQLSLSL